MSFSPETEKLVNDLIQAEYKNACEQFGDKYNSPHEAYAILLEEVEETVEQTNTMRICLKDIWFYIKRNDKAMINFYLNKIQKSDLSCMKELAQIGAVLMKIQNTIGEEEE